MRNQRFFRIILAGVSMKTFCSPVGIVEHKRPWGRIGEVLCEWFLIRCWIFGCLLVISLRKHFERLESDVWRLLHEFLVNLCRVVQDILFSSTNYHIIIVSGGK